MGGDTCHGLQIRDSVGIVATVCTFEDVGSL